MCKEKERLVKSMPSLAELAMDARGKAISTSMDLWGEAKIALDLAERLAAHLGVAAQDTPAPDFGRPTVLHPGIIGDMVDGFGCVQEEIEGVSEMVLAVQDTLMDCIREYERYWLIADADSRGKHGMAILATDNGGDDPAEGESK